MFLCLSNYTPVFLSMQDEQYCGHGTTDGTFRDERYFACKEKCGLFVALDKLSKNPDGSMYTREKVARGGQSYASVDYKNKPHPTDSIDFGNTSTLAKEMGIQLMADQKAVLREAEKSKAAQELKQEAVPDQSIDLVAQRAALHAFRKDDSETRSSLPQLPQPPLYQQLRAFVPDQHQVHQSLTIGSTVQLVTFSDAGPQQPRYGVIRWIGEITGVTGTIAGVELV